MAGNDDLTPEFEKFDFPTDELESALSEGMPDPTAAAVSAEPAGKKGKKKAKKEKVQKEKAEKPKREKPPRERRSKERLPGGPGMVASVFEASPYTVLLAIALAAITIAVLYIIFQIADYKGDYGANAAKQTAAAPAAVRCVEAQWTNIA